ncbi:MAG: hypothetical protein KBB94_04435 [Legionellaceae bacterium]|nr:hypothetical protein [Legionellaceae bacterium]MBP9775481.1 hypothetical protein [Legionellaceae bacterium]
MLNSDEINHQNQSAFIHRQLVVTVMVTLPKLFSGEHDKDVLAQNLRSLMKLDIKSLKCLVNNPRTNNGQLLKLSSLSNFDELMRIVVFDDNRTNPVLFEDDVLEETQTSSSSTLDHTSTPRVMELTHQNFRDAETIAFIIWLLPNVLTLNRHEEYYHRQYIAHDEARQVKSNLVKLLQLTSEQLRCFESAIMSAMSLSEFRNLLDHDQFDLITTYPDKITVLLSVVDTLSVIIEDKVLRKNMYCLAAKSLDPKAMAFVICTTFHNHREQEFMPYLELLVDHSSPQLIIDNLLKFCPQDTDTAEILKIIHSLKKLNIHALYWIYNDKLSLFVGDFAKDNLDALISLDMYSDMFDLIDLLPGSFGQENYNKIIRYLNYKPIHRISSIEKLCQAEDGQDNFDLIFDSVLNNVDPKIFDPKALTDTLKNLQRSGLLGQSNRNSVSQCDNIDALCLAVKAMSDTTYYSTSRLTQTNFTQLIKFFSILFDHSGDNYRWVKMRYILSLSKFDEIIYICEQNQNEPIEVAQQAFIQFVDPLLEGTENEVFLRLPSDVQEHSRRAMDNSLRAFATVINSQAAPNPNRTTLGCWCAVISITTLATLSAALYAIAFLSLLGLIISLLCLSLTVYLGLKYLVPAIQIEVLVEQIRESNPNPEFERPRNSAYTFFNNCCRAFFPEDLTLQMGLR